MKTINENINSVLEIKKSKYITYLYYVNNQELVNKYLADLKDKYNDATHICYAYIIDDYYHYTDDGEPNNTAGLPIYNVLSKNNLNYTLCVVIRYYGGIKLGANGLIRSYSKSAINALKMTKLVKLEQAYHISFNVLINDYEKIKYLLKEDIIKTTFNTNVELEAIVNQKTIDSLNVLNLKIIKPIKKRINQR